MFQMNKSVIILLFLIAGCGGKLSDEQRRQMREQMELHKIVRVTEIEITEAAFEKGRETMKIMDGFRGDPAKTDSFLRRNQGAIHFIVPGASNARALEQQLVDAYLADESGIDQDNVQELRNADGSYDTLLYTKPVTTKMADGSEQLNGIWNIWLSKKELVLELGRKKPD
jgi:hypothetical protein